MEEATRRILDRQDWPTLIKKLTLHSVSRFKFWNLLNEKGLKGFSPEDIAVEAIVAVYTGKWNWNPKKDEDLEFFLKFKVINSMVANLARNKEVRIGDLANVGGLHVEEVFSVVEEVTAEQIVSQVRKSLKGEVMLLDIFERLFNGMERREICEELEITTQIYDNGIKRLKTKLTVLEKTGLFDSLPK